MSELVLGIYRKDLPLDEVAPFKLSEQDQKAYAFIPRDIADAKAVETDVIYANALAQIFPQILGYFQLVNHEGKFLTYQRKGKEKGLFGQRSIGIGGHVSQEDLFEVFEHTGEVYPSLLELVYAGALREVREELGLAPEHWPEFNSVDDFDEAINTALISHNTVTSSRHIGLPLTLRLADAGLDESMLKLDPNEFCNYTWMSVEEMKANADAFEDWSKLLIQAM